MFIAPRYSLRAVWQDLSNRKLSTFITVLVIAVSLTIPTVSYLLWKNTQNAAKQFYPEPEITVYLHKSLADNQVNSLVDKIRTQVQDRVETFNYISRKQSLEEFRSWSGFGEELAILDDNPLPAVITLKPKSPFNQPQARLDLRNELQNITGVEEVRLDNGWLEKLTALTWLIARTAVICTLLMMLAVFLVISNSVRTDVANRRPAIEVQQLLGATDYFIARPFLYTGMIYGLLGSLLAALFSTLTIGYFTSAVKYVADIFTVQFEVSGLALDELLFLVTLCIFMGWLSAKIATNRHIHRIGSRP